MTDRGSLKYARVERERRFLLATVPSGLPLQRTQVIRDRYVSGTRLRLRLVEQVGEQPVWKLGQKLDLPERSPTSLAHTTIYLTADEASVVAVLPGSELTKTRQILSLGDHAFIVDVFHRELHGLILAEIDLGEDGSMPDALPVTPVAEVTGDERFAGGALALTGPGELRALLKSFGA